jgi:hypothetical protein
MKRLSCLVFALALFACHDRSGDRCNPLQFSSDCDTGLTCLYPVTPTCNPTQPGTNCCGVSFCCTVNAAGVITDKNPNCQPDPTAASACGIDAGTAATDGSTD